MIKGSGTRSGLLWEVERLLGEMTEIPQVLLMENVPQVVGSKGIKDFAKWIVRLEEFGYKNYWQCLNAKDYGVPQNRNRCFMISILGNCNYIFPKELPLKYRLKDFLERHADPKYDLPSRKIKMFMEHTRKQQERGNGFKFEPTFGGGQAKSILTRPGERPCDNFIMEEIKCQQVGQIVGKGFNDMTGRVYGTEGLSPTIRTMVGGNTELKIAEAIAYDEQNGYLRQDGCVETLTTDGSSPKHNNRIVEPIIYDDYNGKIRTDQECCGTITTNIGNGAPRNGMKIIEPSQEMQRNFRIRKLTEKECFRLQGVKDEDFEKVTKNQSASSSWHLAGDSIVTTCLMAIFGQLLGVDYKQKITELTEELKEK